MSFIVVVVFHLSFFLFQKKKEPREPLSLAVVGEDLLLGLGDFLFLVFGGQRKEKTRKVSKKREKEKKATKKK